MAGDWWYTRSRPKKWSALPWTPARHPYRIPEEGRSAPWRILTRSEWRRLAWWLSIGRPLSWEFDPEGGEFRDSWSGCRGAWAWHYINDNRQDAELYEQIFGYREAPPAGGVWPDTFYPDRSRSGGGYV